MTGNDREHVGPPEHLEIVLTAGYGQIVLTAGYGQIVLTAGYGHIVLTAGYGHIESALHISVKM